MQIGMLLSVPAGKLRFKSTSQRVLDLRCTKQLHTSVSNYWMQKSSLWREFFAEIGETKNRPVIFFDDMDDKNDKKDFINALPALAGKAYVVLIVRSKLELPFPSDVIQMTAITVPMLLAENKVLEPLDALRTIAITDGIPELVRLFDFQKSFAENLSLLFAHNSVYFRYAESELHRNFRTPETYNILLYGMANRA